MARGAPLDKFCVVSLSWFGKSSQKKWPRPGYASKLQVQIDNFISPACDTSNTSLICFDHCWWCCFSCVQQAVFARRRNFVVGKLWACITCQPLKLNALKWIAKWALSVVSWKLAEEVRAYSMGLQFFFFFFCVFCSVAYGWTPSVGCFFLAVLLLYYISTARIPRRTRWPSVGKHWCGDLGMLNDIRFYPMSIYVIPLRMIWASQCDCPERFRRDCCIHGEARAIINIIGFQLGGEV